METLLLNQELLAKELIKMDVTLSMIVETGAHTMVY